jgi:CDP-diacylglycerol---glycerol-3-phosphate 3-phosphatidyltransferase
MLLSDTKTPIAWEFLYHLNPFSVLRSPFSVLRSPFSAIGSVQRWPQINQYFIIISASYPPSHCPSGSSLLYARPMESIWITVIPLLIINVIGIVTFLVFLSKRERLPAVSDLEGRHYTKLLNRTVQEYWYWVMDPPAKLFLKLRFSPNQLTMTGSAISGIAAWLFATGHFGAGGWTMIFASTFDLFDGRVARLTGRTSRSGAYFDSVMDRLSEGAIFFGLAFYFRSSWMLCVVLVALVGSLLVSYTRARGEAVGVVCKKGPMQRPERMAYLGVASVFHPIADATARMWVEAPLPFLLMGVLCLMAVLTLYTTLYRTIYIMDALDSADSARDEEESVPQRLAKLSTSAGRSDALSQARYGYPRGQARYLTSLVFVAEGMDSAVLQEQLKRGNLPNISRHLLESGQFVETTGVFPSTSGIASLPLVTGCFPGTCNIPGMRWFDRTVPPQKRFTLKRFRDYYSSLGSYAIDFDLSKEVQTVFEYSRQALNLMGMLDRGSGLRRDPAFFHPQRYFGMRDPEACESLERAVFEWFSESLHRRPDFIYYYYPSIGTMTRFHGADHPGTLSAYRRLDQYVGDAAEKLKSYGLLDHTAFMLVGGHGFDAVTQHYDLDGLLSRHFPNLIHSTSASHRHWSEAEAINLTSGNAMSHLYLRSDDRSWSQGRPVETMAGAPFWDALRSEPAVDLIIGRNSEGGVTVHSQRGCAKIFLNGEVRYEVSGGDPFGYGTLPGRMTRLEALERTSDSAYPDGIIQAAQLLKSPRSGDLALSARAGVTFTGNTPEGDREVAAHGALSRAQMMSPVAVSIPVPFGHPVRSTDLFPYLLRQEGISLTQSTDGRAV